MLSLTFAAALAMAPQQISTPEEYTDCLQKTSKQVALDYEDVDDAVPRIMAACENIWDRWKQETLRRHPNGAGTIADLKSRMRDQVREFYANTSVVHQRDDLLDDLIEADQEAKRRVTVDTLIGLYIDCQVRAARSAVEQRIDADRIADHVERECSVLDADVAKRLPTVIDESLVAGSRVSADQVAAFKRRSVQKVLDGMRESARQAYAPLVQQARRRESCIAEDHEAGQCDLNTDIFLASFVFDDCVGASARKSAMDGDTFEQAVGNIDSACSEEWAAVVELSRHFDNSEAKRTKLLQALHAALKRDYPKLLEQAGNAGEDAQ